MFGWRQWKLATVFGLLWTDRKVGTYLLLKESKVLVGDWSLAAIAGAWWKAGGGGSGRMLGRWSGASLDWEELGSCPKRNQVKPSSN